MKTILIDCDGVLLDWETAFVSFLDGKGHPVYTETAYTLEEMFGIHSSRAMALCQEFNNSARIGFLNPLSGAVENIAKLSSDGFRFKCITSMGTCPFSHKLRIANLESIFGKVFNDYVFLGCGADKEEELRKYQGSNLFWIEDKAVNANTGVLCGLNSILLTHRYNTGVYLDPKVTRCNNWDEIGNFIQNETRRTQ